MKKIKSLYILYTVLFILILVFVFYLHISLQFGKGVLNMSKELYQVKKEWKKNKENPLDSIKNNITKTIDSVNKKRIENSLEK